jgi:hypothetical protein
LPAPLCADGVGNGTPYRVWAKRGSDRCEEIFTIVTGLLTQIACRDSARSDGEKSRGFAAKWRAFDSRCQGSSIWSQQKFLSPKFPEAAIPPFLGLPGPFLGNEHPSSQGRKTRKLYPGKLAWPVGRHADNDRRAALSVRVWSVHRRDSIESRNPGNHSTRLAAVLCVHRASRRRRLA